MKKRTLLVFLIFIAIFTFNTNLFAGPGGGITLPRANIIIVTEIDTEEGEKCYEKKNTVNILDYYCNIHI